MCDEWIQLREKPILELCKAQTHIVLTQYKVNYVNSYHKTSQQNEKLPPWFPSWNHCAIVIPLRKLHLMCENPFLDTQEMFPA